MIRVCISGLSASGKTSLGEELARELKILHITKDVLETHKRIAEEMEKEGEDALRVIEAGDERYAKSFDDEVAELAAKGNCVVTTWLGPWLVKDPTVRVWLTASVEERAKRRAAQRGIDISEARKLIDEKDKLTMAAFKDVYGIDVMDHAAFDFMVNTERVERKDSVALIAMLAMKRDGPNAFK